MRQSIRRCLHGYYIDISGRVDLHDNILTPEWIHHVFCENVCLKTSLSAAEVIANSRLGCPSAAEVL